MITLIHGEDIVRSRNELLNIKETYTGKEIRYIDGKSTNENILTQALSSSSLFGNDTVVIIEQLFGSLGKKIKVAESYISLLISHESSTEIVLWEDKELSKTIVTKFGKQTNNKLFVLPTMLFQFLDSIQPHAAKKLFIRYEELIRSEPPELVHALLSRRIRQLLFIKSNVQTSTMSPWQLTRLTNQSRLFTMNQLLQLYRSILQIELEFKTGSSYLSLHEATERMISDII